MSTIFYLPKQSPLDTASNLMAGAKLYFYVTLTSTPKDTYSDSALTTPNTNPVVADGSGVFSTIYLSDVGRYRVVLKTSADVTQYTQDDVGAAVASQAELGAILYPLTTAENAAGVTPTNYAYAPGDIRRYGTNTTPGTTDMTAAIQAAIDQQSHNGDSVKLPAETLATDTLTFYSGTVILGSGRVISTLKYTGSAQLFKQSTPGTRIYGVIMRDFNGDDSGTGTIGIDLDSVSESFFEDLTINGFDTGVKIYSPTAGFSVYNRLIQVKAQNATTGFLITGQSSNANVLFACRGNVCTMAVDIVDSNENHVIASQFESGTNGIRVTTATASAARNYIESNRFENNSGTNITVGTSSCSDTLLFANYHATGTAYADSGLRTQFFDMYPNAAGLPMISLNSVRASTDGVYKFTRSASATAIPVAHIQDTVSGSGTPDQLWLTNERGTGFYIRNRRGGNDIAFWNAAGALQIAGTAPTVAASQVGIGATTSTTVGAAGGAAAPPATPTGYWVINVAGTAFKVPYYAS